MPVSCWRVFHGVPLSEKKGQSMSFERSTSSRRFDRRALIRAGSAGVGAAALAKAGLAGAQDASPAATAALPEYDGSAVTITYGIWDAAQEDGIRQQIAAFNEEFPDITVELQLTPWSDYWTKLQTAVAGGEAFDVFWLNSANCPVYASAGALVPLQQLFDDGSLDAANYPESVLSLYNWDGIQWATPREYDTIGLFYNKDIFDEAGEPYPDETWDWAKMREVAERLADEDAGRWGLGLHLGGQENYTNFIFQNEGQLLNEERTLCVVADDENSAEAIRTNIQFFADGLTPGVDIQQANPVPETLFPAGQVAMMPGGSFRAKTYADLDINVDVAPLPKGKVQATVIHGLGNVVWSGSQNQGAAIEFAKFLAGETAERILGESGMGIPAFNGLETTWTDALPDMNAQVFIDASSYGVNVPDPEVGPEWQGRLGEEMLKGFAGETPVDDVPQAAQDSANEVLPGE
jgi:multiple sugar transport system substrate-binding protein